jgi:hypothetical protein
VDYNADTVVDVEPGSLMCNGSPFRSTQTVEHTMTSLDTLHHFSYIYMDYSASTSPTNMVFIDNTNGPAYDDELDGWYQGNDRVIGVVLATNGASKVHHFASMPNGDYISTAAEPEQIASDMDPVHTWQTPDDFESSRYIPWNASHALILMQNKDAGGVAELSMDTVERIASLNPNPLHGNLAAYTASSWAFVSLSAWVSLGPSRNIRFVGADDDDNLVNGYIMGWRLDR